MSPDPASPLGFIGLGLLGQAMALRLAQSGHRLVVWNREPERALPLAEAGAQIAASPAEVAARCGRVCLCVIDGRAVREVVFGAQGVATPGRATHTLIDFSTVDPATTRALAAEAAGLGLRWVDAPVSGGPAAALEGTLTVMCGGSAEAVQAAQPVLQAVASRCTHVGEAGSGQEMKVVNQALVGGTTVLLAEALALAHALGLPLDKVPGCLEGGLADSVALQKIWPRMAGARFEPPMGRAAQLLKDLEAVEGLRQSHELSLPMLQAGIGQYRGYVHERGAGEADSFSVSRLYLG
mgnify:FL=1